MKTFRYKLGHEAGSTMTVGELIAALQKHPADLPVMATWEGVNAYIRPENFAIATVHKGNLEDSCECLVIDVEEY